MSGMPLRRPNRNALTALVFLLWGICSFVWRDYVWGDLRDGLVSLRGLSRPMRALILIGFALLAGMLAALLLNDVWRSQFDLLPRIDGAPGRGALVPQGLIPVTLFMLVVAWSFALTGALHSHWLIRLGVLGIYLLNALGWTNMSSTYYAMARGLASTSDVAILVAGLAFTFFVPVFFLMRAWGRSRPVFEFMVIFTAVTGVISIAQVREVDNWRQFGIPLMLGTLDTTVSSLQGLILPLLLIVGIDMASFANEIAQLVTKVATRYFPGWAIKIAFGALLIWRLCGVVGDGMERVGKSSLSTEVVSYLGSLGVIASVAIAWVLASRLSLKHREKEIESEEISDATGSAALPLIVVYSAIQLIIFVMLTAALAIPPLDVGAVIQAGMVALSSPLNSILSDPWHLLVAFGAIGACLVLARRGQQAMALYLGIFGFVEIWYWATDPGSLLGTLTWSGPEVLDFWWVIILAACGVYWVVRRRLTSERAAAVFLLLLLTELQRQTTFIGNRFSPLFGFAGIGFLAFGLAYDAISIGSWANAETRALPRPSRIFLYLGYVLLTVTVVSWALASHDLKGLDILTGNGALVGMQRFGRPMLYGIFAAVLARQFKVPRPAELVPAS